MVPIVPVVQQLMLPCFQLEDCENLEEVIPLQPDYVTRGNFAGEHLNVLKVYVSKWMLVELLKCRVL